MIFDKNDVCQTSSSNKAKIELTDELSVEVKLENRGKVKTCSSHITLFESRKITSTHLEQFPESHIFGWVENVTDPIRYSSPLHLL